jgi:ribonuclease HI
MEVYLDNSFLTLYQCNPDELLIFVDGGFKENEAYGSGIIANDKDILFHERWDFPKARTNNQAEYLSLIHILRHLLDQFNQRKIKVYIDSQLIEKQIKGLYKVKDPYLVACRNSVTILLGQFNVVKIEHIPGILMKSILGH